ncbi:hypothetical protein SBV1_1530037 [Verrucomicrobia bacterium]|nr:hypothetical protein SBV1_1530037 [Verrucomicrobiota bacterium]
MNTMNTIPENAKAARNGKIARLPYELRETLNQRLQEGHEGKSLLRWLNSSAQVQQVLAEHFEGASINAQNLTEWRQGGYQDWLADQERRDLVCRIADQALGFEDAAQGTSLSERLSTILVAELAFSVHTLLAPEIAPEQRWKRLQGMIRCLTQLRREDTKAQKARTAPKIQMKQSSKPLHRKNSPPEPLPEPELSADGLAQVLNQLGLLEALGSAHAPVDPDASVATEQPKTVNGDAHDATVEQDLPQSSPIKANQTSELHAEQSSSSSPAPEIMPAPTTFPAPLPAVWPAADQPQEESAVGGNGRSNSEQTATAVAPAHTLQSKPIKANQTSETNLGLSSSLPPLPEIVPLFSGAPAAARGGDVSSPHVAADLPTGAKESGLRTQRESFASGVFE